MARYPARELQEEFLNTIQKSQETVIEAVRTWADTVQSMMPKVPSVRPLFADRLPKPDKVVAGAYDFAEKLLASQRQFAEELLKATTPLMLGIGGDAQKEKAAAAR